MKALFLQASDIQSLVKSVGADRLMAEITSALEETFRNYSKESIRSLPRQGFTHRQGLLEWMPASRESGRTALKMVGYQPLNPTQEELPTILATLGLYDGNTGRLEFFMDGTLLTALRTGAASAIACRYLARPDSSTLSLIGCGCQAFTQLQGLTPHFKWNRVLAYDRDLEQAQRFCQRVDELGLAPVPVEVVTLNQAVAESDVVCVATSNEVGGGPVITADLSYKPWLHINAVGADFPGKIEIAHNILESAFVCPDYLSQAILEGECQQLRAEQIGPELPFLIQDTKLNPGSDKLSVFDSTGWALEDLVAAEIFKAHAERLGLGTFLELEGSVGDPRDPYRFLSSAVVAER